MRGRTLKGSLILVGAGDMTMDGRTKPNGTVDYTNLDHNDANALPGATLTPEKPLQRRWRSRSARSTSPTTLSGVERSGDSSRKALHGGG